MRLQDLAGIAIIFLVVAIIIGVGTDVISGVRDTKATTEGISIVNESGTFTGGSLEVAGVAAPRGAFAWGGVATAFADTSFTLTNSSNSTIGSSNYNAYTNGSIILNNGSLGAEGGIGADSLVNVSYSYTIEATSIFYNATSHGLESQEELGSWLPTIAIIVAAAVIIGIIGTYFAIM